MPSLPTLSQNLLNETNLQSCMKLKLQLFPVDEGTRRALEMVGQVNLFAVLWLTGYNI